MRNSLPPAIFAISIVIVLLLLVAICVGGRGRYTPANLFVAVVESGKSVVETVFQKAKIPQEGHFLLFNSFSALFVAAVECGKSVVESGLKQ